MITHAFSIYDRKALRFHAPFFALSIGEAVRSLTELVNDPNTTPGKYPDDFVLFHVGDFDDSTGGVLPISPVAHVADAVALVREDRRQVREVRPFPGSDTAMKGEG